LRNMNNYILVLNLGLKSVRSIVFNKDGKKLSQISSPIETSLKDVRVEQDPGEWWRKAKQVIQESISYGDIAQQIGYMTVTTSSSCLVPVGKDFQHLHPAIMVSDDRAVDQAHQLSQMNEFSEVNKNTGLGAKAHLMLPKILWLKDNLPEVFKNTAYFLSPNDYLIAQLSKRAVTDYFNAQKSYFDPITRNYPTALLKEAGISERKLPEVVPPGTNIGKLNEEVALVLGLPSSVEVVLSTYDAICAFYGSGGTEPGTACDVSGTVSSLRVLTNVAVSDPTERIFTTPDLANDLFLLGGSNNLGGGLIEWARQALYQDEQHPYEVMETEAQKSGMCARGLLFLPYLLGERAPLWDTDVRGAFLGLERFHGRGDMMQAIFESAAFGIRNIMQAIEDTGTEVQSIRTSGGLSRIGCVQNLKADITGRKISVVDEIETTSLGAAMLVGIGIGLFKNLNEAAKLVRIRMEIYPDPERHAIYCKYHELFCDAYEMLKPFHQKRKDLLKNLIQRVETKVTNL
jgi:xylulokinase